MDFINKPRFEDNQPPFVEYSSHEPKFLSDDPPPYEAELSQTTVAVNISDLEARLADILPPPDNVLWARLLCNIPYFHLLLWFLPLYRIVEMVCLLRHDKCPDQKLVVCLIFSVMPLLLRSITSKPAMNWGVVLFCTAAIIVMEYLYGGTMGSTLIFFVHVYFANDLKHPRAKFFESRENTFV